MKKLGRAASRQKSNLKRRKKKNVDISADDVSTNRTTARTAADDSPVPDATVEELKAHSVEFLEKLKKTNGVRCLRQEFVNMIKLYRPSGSSEVYQKNMIRNRYDDVFCLDTTRIKISDEANDYIHASRVRTGKNHYICAQGPLKETMVHFWKMIFQENVKVVVMLCQIFEDGKPKCEEYYPRKQGLTLTIGDFKITNSLMTTGTLDKVTVSKLDVTNGKKTVQLSHVMLDGWCDHCAPESVRMITDLQKMVLSMNVNRAPILVHCSAGVGRTGTFVALDLAYTYLNEMPKFDMVEVVKRIRDQRLHSVQTDQQYLFLCRAMVDYLIERKAINDSDVAKFLSDYDDIVKRKRKEQEDKNRRKKISNSQDDDG